MRLNSTGDDWFVASSWVASQSVYMKDNTIVTQIDSSPIAYIVQTLGNKLNENVLVQLGRVPALDPTCDLSKNDNSANSVRAIFYSKSNYNFKHRK